MTRLNFLKTMALMITVVLAKQGQSEEPIHAELVRLQRETGLTLASYFRNVQTVMFANGDIAREGVFHPGGVPQWGEVSRDGTWLAVDVWTSADAATKHDREFLAVGKRDGSGFREYHEIGQPYGICWSFDDSALVVHSRSLLRLDLASGATREVDETGYVTSQCWSPEGRQVVFGTPDNAIRVYDFDIGKSRELAKGKSPTWSPDGQWIAFLDGDNFYVIRPNGEGKKLLFKSLGVRTPLLWSPDSRFVAYVCPPESRSFADVIKSPLAVLQLRVRRLADNSEDDVIELAEKSYLSSYQWLQPLKPIKHQRASNPQ